MGRAGQLGQSPAADGSRMAPCSPLPAVAPQALYLQGGVCPASTRPSLANIAPLEQVLPPQLPSAHGGAREWVYPCLTSGLASEERL